MVYKLLALSALSVVVTACVSVAPLAPAGSKVVVTSNAPPASCHLLKSLTEGSINGVEMHYRSHHEIQTDQLNQLRNQTASLGGNLFVVHAHETTYQPITTGINDSPDLKNVAEGHHTMVDSHTISGGAYLCDAKGLVEVSTVPSQAKKLSDIHVAAE